VLEGIFAYHHKGEVDTVLVMHDVLMCRYCGSPYIAYYTRTTHFGFGPDGSVLQDTDYASDFDYCYVCGEEPDFEEGTLVYVPKRSLLLAFGRGSDFGVLHVYRVPHSVSDDGSVYYDDMRPTEIATLQENEFTLSLLRSLFSGDSSDEQKMEILETLLGPALCDPFYDGGEEDTYAAQ